MKLKEFSNYLVTRIIEASNLNFDSGEDVVIFSTLENEVSYVFKEFYTNENGLLLLNINLESSLIKKYKGTIGDEMLFNVFLSAYKNDINRIYDLLYSKKDIKNTLSEQIKELMGPKPDIPSCNKNALDNFLEKIKLN